MRMLAAGVPHIDAVEIDPKILDLGKRLNPEKPYQDPRVTTYVNDGRAFMRNSDKRYDLIAFALPDSLTLTSGFSNLRLESFLLTKEAIIDAKDHCPKTPGLAAFEGCPDSDADGLADDQDSCPDEPGEHGSRTGLGGLRRAPRSGRRRPLERGRATG